MSADDWFVPQVRLSIFSSADRFSVSESLWQALTGESEAQSRISIPGGRQYFGRMLGGQLVLAATQLRIDIVLSYQAEVIVEKLPALGPWSEVTKAFVSMCENFLTASNLPICRIAYAVTGLVGVPSVPDALKRLQGMLTSVKIEPDGMRDLLYKVNWPQPSKVVDRLRLNRLTTWSAQSVQISYTNEGIELGKTTLPVAQLDVDNNTQPEHIIAFEKSQLVPILRELVAMAQENAERGEIA